MIKQTIKNFAYKVIKSKPDFLILGAQKAGTTSLYNYLTQHPQILGNIGFKEVRYFDRSEHYDLGMGWYLGNFPSKIKRGNNLTCDASPNYLYYEFVPERIKKDLGSPKMIVILREPVSRAYSAWQMFHSFKDIENDHLRQFFDKRLFFEAVEEESCSAFDHSIYPFRYDYIKRGVYAPQLRRYYHCFERENLLVLSMDELRSSLQSTLDKVCKFLEIETFPVGIIQNLSNKKYNKGKYEFDRHPKDKDVLDYLRKYFAPFNSELYDLLGYRYPW